MTAENNIESKLAELGLTLPIPSAPVANYVGYVRTGNLVHISGQISKVGEETVTGHLGRDLAVERGQHAARLCALNLLAQMKAAAGSLERVARVVKLGGFVQCAPGADGADIPKVINGASDLMVELFGERGRHARFAVSAPVLPLGVAVEIDAVVELREP